MDGGAWEAVVHGVAKSRTCLSDFTLTFFHTYNMYFGPITSWQIEREKVEAVTDYIFLGSKITVNNDCRHEINRHLLLGRKAIANLDSV